MAKRRPATTVDQDTTMLRWDRSRLEGQLAKQVAEGATIASALDTTASIITARAEVSTTTVAEGIESAGAGTPGRWHERNRTILRQAFTTTRVLNEYDPPAKFASVDTLGSPRSPRQQTEHLRQLHAHRLGRLQGVAERVDLYERPAARAAGGEATDPGELEDVFVVHGRDDATKNEVARTLHQLLGREAVILHEQPDGGATIIEKFEHHANLAAAAVVILSPDDVGGLAPGDDLQPRARQNVVYELGWFHGRLGRGRVIALLVDDVDKPSDISGVLYIAKDPAAAWRTALARELRNAGLPADANRLR